MKIRTRFAPSPTGYLHIGGLRTALYAYLFAKKNGGDFLLRIEDTDRERLVDDACAIIYRTLKDVGLIYDEGPDVGGSFGPYIQSERCEIYRKYALELVQRGAAYYCFCDKERLSSLKENGIGKYDKHCLHLSQDEIERNLAAGLPYVIRQNIPASGQSVYDDMVYGTISVPCADMEDNVLLKSDGYPTYNLANVIDDHLMEISHVIRGQEYLSSTPKYNLLYDAMGWQRPKYIHLPPVMKNSAQKLSKRHGDASYEDFIEKGFLKEAIINYVALLGWSPGGEREKFCLDELTQVFTLEGISKSPSIFDVEKLTWLNGEYIRAMSPEDFLDAAKPLLKDVPEKFSHAKIAAILQPRLETLAQIPEKISFFEKLPEFSPELYFNKKMKTDEQSAKVTLSALLPILETQEDFTSAALYELISKYAEQIGVKNGALLWPLRISLSGTLVTPGGATEIAEILGKDETVSRIRKALSQ